MTYRRWYGYLFLLPYLALFGLFLIVPLVYGLGLSLFRWEILSRVPPAFVGLGNFHEALTSDNFWKALWASARFVLMATPLTVGLALLIAVGLHSVGPKRQALYRAAYFIPTMVTISVAGILWRWFFNSEFGVFNALLNALGLPKAPWLTDTGWAMPSIVIMTLWWTVGGPMVVLLAGLQNIAPHYLEAASLDGATPWQRYRYVALPLLRPVLFFVIVMNVIGAFQVFGQTFMITRGGPELSTRSLVQYIYETAFNNYRMGFAASMSWLLFLVIVVISGVQARLMREK
ncbi:MAG TPA: sugar ABC transporter permease [Chthonomonadaceae bacterium]|nr:sugar ABC transporter permease [Chthonomonadaceae bacterium]